MRIFLYEHITAGGLGSDVPSSLVREGRAMLNAIVTDFQHLPGIEVVTIEGAHLATFKQAAAACDWSLVIAPEFDHHLRDRSQAVLDAGGRLLGPSPGAIELTGDKLALAEFWRVRGVRTPWTDVLTHADWTHLDLPIVLKPRHGAGSQETWLVDVATSAILVAEIFDLSRRERIVQEFIRGQATSVAVLIGKAQTIPLAPARQHLSNDGRLRYEGGSLPLALPLAARAKRLAVQAVAGIDGLQGYVGVDLVLGEDGVDHAIEINPRLTTSYLGLRRLCLDNLAELMLKCVGGQPIDPPRWRDEPIAFGIDDSEGNP
ncbi:MAG: ATP-grasp domain-containing protein [Planctomycetes bacterium]|nr:ATP-grasp domain-containing protein [Planctomycetota bacterium]